MYDICGDVSKFLTTEGNTKEAVREFFDLESVLPGYQVDDYLLELVTHLMPLKMISTIRFM